MSHISIHSKKIKIIHFSGYGSWGLGSGNWWRRNESGLTKIERAFKG